MFKKFGIALAVLLTLLTAEYRMAPGDTIEVEFKKLTELSSKQKISLDGTINLPLLKIIKVAGLTQEELQTKLDADYKQFTTGEEPVVYLTPRPIYIIWRDQKDDSIETKVAATPDEARALCGKDYKGEIEPGQVIEINHGRPYSWWGNNWYKLLSALSMIVVLLK